MANSSLPLALVLEDDVASAEALAFILRDWGADVVCCVDRAGIETALGQRLPRARWIITDYNLGADLDGVTLALDVRRVAAEARVLVLSGSFQGRAAAAAAAAGLDFMNKPARAEAIIAWLERT
ncbi:MAG: hypothetical protein AB7O98_03990 [Hyphomonadaceae bacterium]